MDSVTVVHGFSCSMACGIFWTRDRTHGSCIGRQILIHCTTTEGQNLQISDSVTGECVRIQLGSPIPRHLIDWLPAHVCPP